MGFNMQSYKIIIYELIIFKVDQKGRTITKRYFQKVKSVPDVLIKDLSKKMLELKQKYNDNKYIIDFISDNGIDLIAKMNEKSEKAYKKYVERGYK